MNYMKLMIIIITIVSIIVVSGCSDIIVDVPDTTPATVESPTATVLTSNVTPTIPSVTPLPEDFIKVNDTSPEATTTVPTTIPTTLKRTPKPTIVPIETMNETEPYKEYSDTDFKVKYPSNWTVEYTTIPFVSSTMNAQNSFHPKSKQIVFHGQNTSVKFIATISDLYNIGTGNLKHEGIANFQYDINTCANTITVNYPDVDGLASISDYIVRYTDGYQTAYVQFHVIIPETSSAYPLAYTERDLMSYSHYYNFRFITPGMTSDYNNIADTMFSSLKTEEKAMTSDWLP